MKATNFEGGTLNITGTGGGIVVQDNATSPNIIGGYSGNSVNSGVVGAVVGGGGQSGTSNRVTDEFGVVGGGTNNRAGDGNDGDPSDATFATVGGGQTNVASAAGATVGGGGGNTAGGFASTISGGQGNITSGSESVISGGSFNSGTGSRATISGGQSNITSADGATIGGGLSNNVGGALATVGGGLANIAPGYIATVPGGDNNAAAGTYSFAAGQRAKAYHTGAFVWADSASADFASTANNQFLIRAAGGVGIGTNAPAATLDVAGTSFMAARFANNATSGDRTALVDIRNGDNVTWRLGVGGTGNGLGLTAGQFYLEQFGFGAVLATGVSGNVGIGTTAPSQKLDVRGNIKLGSSGELYATGATENVRIIRGKVNADGTCGSGVGFTCSRVGPGYFSVTFTAPFASEPVVTATLRCASAPCGYNSVSVIGASTSGFNGYVAGFDGSPHDYDF